MLRRLYDWTLSLAGHRHALWALAIVAFVESSVFPIPPDVLVLPMVLAARDKAWRIALVATLASVAGGLLGYGIGALLYDTLGQPVLAFYGYEPQFVEFQKHHDLDPKHPAFIFSLDNGPRVIEFYAPWCPHVRFVSV